MRKIDSLKMEFRINSILAKFMFINAFLFSKTFSLLFFVVFIILSIPYFLIAVPIEFLTNYFLEKCINSFNYVKINNVKGVFTDFGMIYICKSCKRLHCHLFSEKDINKISEETYNDIFYNKICTNCLRKRNQRLFK